MVRRLRSRWGQVREELGKSRLRTGHRCYDGGKVEVEILKGNCVITGGLTLQDQDATASLASQR